MRMYNKIGNSVVDLTTVYYFKNRTTIELLRMRNRIYNSVVDLRIVW